MTRVLPAALAGLLAVAVALATRWPAAALDMAAGGLLSAATLTFGLLSCRGVGRPWTGPLALAAGAALLILPPGLEPWFALPAVAAALPMLAYFHLLLKTEVHVVARLGGGEPSRLRAALRLLPWAALVGLAAAAPLLAEHLLPTRLASSSELRGPAGPLLAAALAGVLVLAYAFALRAVRRAPVNAAPTDDASAEASAVGAGGDA